MCLQHGRGLFARGFSLRETRPANFVWRPAKHDSMSRREFFLVGKYGILVVHVGIPESGSSYIQYATIGVALPHPQKSGRGQVNRVS